MRLLFELFFWNVWGKRLVLSLGGFELCLDEVSAYVVFLGCLIVSPLTEGVCVNAYEITENFPVLCSILGYYFLH